MGGDLERPPVAVTRQGVHPIRPEDQAWTKRSRRLETFLCDVVFHVSHGLYVGPDNGTSGRAWEEVNVRLQQPDLRYCERGRVLSEDLLGREDELVAYYGRLVRVAEEHGKAGSLRRPFPYFSLSPAIISDGRMLATFPWSDDVPEAKSVLEALARPDPDAGGLVLDDQDQSWRIRFVAVDDAVHFVEWDAEGPPPVDGGFQVEAAALAALAGAALDRLETIHAAGDGPPGCRRP